jgi:hypothetical protein
MTTRTNTLDRQPPRRRFTPAGFISFLLAVAAYSFLVVTLSRPLTTPCVEREDVAWPVIAMIPVTWCLLWWLYQRWRLPNALWVHFAGLIAGMLSLVASVILGLLPFRFTDIPTVAFVVMLLACLMSTAASLPAATLMLLYLMFRPSSKSDF